MKKKKIDINEIAEIAWTDEERILLKTKDICSAEIEGANESIRANKIILKLVTDRLKELGK